MTTDQVQDRGPAKNDPGAGCWPRVRPILAMLGLASALGLVGCGEDELPPGMTKQSVAFAEVPDPLRAAARKAIPGVEFDEAWKNVDPGGKLHSYEIRGRKASDGKIREVRVALDGRILEQE